MGDEHDWARASRCKAWTLGVLEISFAGSRLVFRTSCVVTLLCMRGEECSSLQWGYVILSVFPDIWINTRFVEICRPPMVTTMIDQFGEDVVIHAPVSQDQAGHALAIVIVLRPIKLVVKRPIYDLIYIRIGKT